MKMQLICQYCDNHWMQYVYSSDTKGNKCPVCSDKHIRYKELDADKVDYYQGCPPFVTDLPDEGFDY